MYQRPKWESGRERQLSLVSLFCLTGLTSSDFHFELLNFTLVVSLAPDFSLPVSVPGTLRMPLSRLYKLSSCSQYTAGLLPCMCSFVKKVCAPQKYLFNGFLITQHYTRKEKS